ncbi:transposase [Streptomyces sp. DSM 15324]|uniref:transposase n=1 Tax=Streptomyces sp. DSM 15324 TaxID=1739111 RepID=UPI0018FE38C6
MSAARYRFHAHAADHAHLPELLVPAETVEQWWNGIETYLTTGITNAASEGDNRLIKLEAATPSASATERTNASAHAVQPSAGADEKRTPAEFEDSVK